MMHTRTHQAALAAAVLLTACSGSGPAIRPEVYKIQRWALLSYAGACSINMSAMVPDMPTAQVLSVLPASEVLAMPLELGKGVASEAFKSVLTNRWGKDALDRKAPDHVQLMGQVMHVEFSPAADLARSETYKYLPGLGTAWCGGAGTRALDPTHLEAKPLQLVARELGVDGMVFVRFRELSVEPMQANDAAGVVTTEVVLVDARGTELARRAYERVATTRPRSSFGNELVADLVGVPAVGPASDMVLGAMDASLNMFLQEYQASRPGKR